MEGPVQAGSVAFLSFPPRWPIPVVGIAVDGFLNCLLQFNFTMLPAGCILLRRLREELQLSYVVYALLLCLILYGMKFAGKERFHDDFMSLEVTKCLQGICAVCIMLHHVSQTPAFRQTKDLSIFPDAGFLFVGIFFFCSGFGLIKSVRSKPGYLDTFLKKRLPTVLIPFYVMTAAYALYYVVTGKQMPLVQWIFSAVGLVLMNSHAWYVIVIALLYLSFYFVFTRVKSEKTAFVIMGFCVLFQLVFGIFWGHLAWWAGKPFWWQSPDGFATAKWWMMPATLWFQGEWWINSTVLFYVGMLFARYETHVVSWFRKRYWVKLAVAVAALCVFYGISSCVMSKFSYWSEFGSERSLGIADKFACLLSQTPYVVAFSVVVFLAMMKVRLVNPVTKFLGKIALEIYLMHNICLMQFGSLIGSPSGGSGNPQPVIAEYKTNLMLFAALVIMGGILLGAIFNFLNGKLLKVAIRPKS